MPKQVGLIKIKGKLGDTSFYKSKDGYLVRDKGGVEGKRIKSDPRFKRTRENMSEFGHAAQKAAQIRKLLAPVIQKIKDGKMNARLVGRVKEVMNADTTHPRGERVLSAGDLSLLKGFDFNAGSPLVTTFFGAYSTHIDRAGGTAGVEIPLFDPEDALVSPPESTHFRFVAGVLEWDPAEETGVLSVERSGYLPTNEAVAADMSLEGSIPANTIKPVFIVLGVEFAQELNGSNYVLSDSSYVCAKIVEVGV